MITPAFWQGKSVFVTGHTGFKGGWACRWLAGMGAQVHGYSLAPQDDDSLFTLAGIGGLCARSQIADIRDASLLRQAVLRAKPDVVLHFAAQPLVKLSYEQPVATFETNVMGTIHLLEAVRALDAGTICLIVTSDKCYDNPNDAQPLAEDAKMGGADPYSASKGACEIAVAAWMQSYFNGPDSPRIATVRAGNVIGGGDWAENRLLPDAIRAFVARKPLIIRNPRSTRPWQHVLEPVSGYLTLVEALSRDAGVARHINFGPHPQDVIPVSAVADLACDAWGQTAQWQAEGQPQDWHEAKTLLLDVTLAARALHWVPCLTTADAVRWTIDWWRAVLADGSQCGAVCDRQIDDYMARCA